MMEIEDINLSDLNEGVRKEFHEWFNGFGSKSVAKWWAKISFCRYVDVYRAECSLSKNFLAEILNKLGRINYERDKYIDNFLDVVRAQCTRGTGNNKQAALKLGKFVAEFKATESDDGDRDPVGVAKVIGVLRNGECMVYADVLGLTDCVKCMENWNNAAVSVLVNDVEKNKEKHEQALRAACEETDKAYYKVIRTVREYKNEQKYLREEDYEDFVGDLNARITMFKGKKV